ncbi:MAG TPA: hypothetical protein VG326_03325 [Tepidisphaeraceae bacterium]|nr:hypothetical protein [Tepidisphaeraceae bacterium]
MQVSPPRPHGSRKVRRTVTDEDLRLYRAITGSSPHPADMKFAPPVEIPAPQTISAIARRVLAPDVAQLSLRLREMCEMGIANGVKRPQMADWLRHVSDEAFKRLDQAQARLSQSRSIVTRRRVEAREVSATHANRSVKLQNVA